MKTTKGFTIFELLLIIAIIAIIAALAIPVMTSGGQSSSCRGGYLFDMRSNRQIIGVNGGGVPC